MRHAFWRLLCIVGSALCADAETTKPLLDFSITSGTNDCMCSAPQWSRTIGQPEVQRLLLRLTSAPMDVDSVEAELRGVGATTARLEELRLIRRDGGQYVLNFALFTAADVRKVREVSERYAESLVAAVAAKSSRIESTLRPYSPVGVDPKEAVFIVLGCFALNWDVMEAAAKNGYRKEGEKRADGWYVPWAVQLSDEPPLRSYIAGSTKTRGNIGTITFGDAESFPRMGFPNVETDLFRILRLAPSVDTAGRQLGLIMLALRKREATPAELTTATQIGGSQLDAWLKWLTELDYVEERNGRYHAKIPVFAEGDASMVRNLRQIGREVAVNWLHENYGHMKAELGGTTPSRWGIPYEEGFNLVLHSVLGSANRRLVEKGLFADPYAGNRKHKGYIAAVYESDVTHVDAAGAAGRWLAVPITGAILLALWCSRLLRRRRRERIHMAATVGQANA